MIKSFANWLVEGVTPEQADKEIAKMQKWADEKGIEIKVHDSDYSESKQNDDFERKERYNNLNNNDYRL